MLGTGGARVVARVLLVLPKGTRGAHAGGAREPGRADARVVFCDLGVRARVDPTVVFCEVEVLAEHDGVGGAEHQRAQEQRGEQARERARAVRAGAAPRVRLAGVELAGGGTRVCHHVGTLLYSTINSVPPLGARGQREVRARATRGARPRRRRGP